MLTAAERESQRQTQRFEELLDRCERLGSGQLPFDELRELGRLYRAHATRLARSRQRGDDPEVIRYLNALCVRAYTFLYAAPQPMRVTGRSLLAELPAMLGRTWRPQVIAWILLLTGMLIGATLGLRAPDSVHALVPSSMGYSPFELDRLISSPLARQRFLDRGAVPAYHNFFFGSYLFVRNTRVGLLAFATGMLAGVPTVLLQLYNGIVLGAFASIFFRDPWPIAFLAWILPHAIPELTAITLCAAGGLVLGEAVAAPGRRGQREALKDALNPALLLFSLAIPLFAVAALVESFVRESTMGTGPRLAIAAALGSAIVGATIYVRRQARRLPVETGWLREIIAPVRSGLPDSGSVPTR